MINLKPMFIGSIILFEAASALCGAAPTMDALIVGRAIAGVGGTGIFLGYDKTWAARAVLTVGAEF
jgi:MFS family permease